MALLFQDFKKKISTVIVEFAESMKSSKRIHLCKSQQARNGIHFLYDCRYGICKSRRIQIISANRMANLQKPIDFSESSLLLLMGFFY